MIQKRLALIINFITAQNGKFWSRSRPNLVGAGADPIWSEPESAPGPWTSGAGAAQKSAGSPTLFANQISSL